MKITKIQVWKYPDRVSRKVLYDSDKQRKEKQSLYDRIVKVNDYLEKTVKKRLADFIA